VKRRDGDGHRVKSVIGNYSELTGSTVTKYYFAGASRIAMRKYTIPQSMTVEYLLGDHLGSTSLTTDANGTKVSEMRYCEASRRDKPCPLRYTSGVLRKGEVRSWWTAGLSTTPAYELSNYTLRQAQGIAFTGQYSHMDDPSTAGVTEGFGLMFYVSRMYDPALGRFAQADSIVPGGVQGCVVHPKTWTVELNKVNCRRRSANANETEFQC
jgi:hypothetical protein